MTDQELQAKLEECRQLLRDYRAKPNSQDYGPYQAWLGRVDHALSDL